MARLLGAPEALVAAIPAPPPRGSCASPWHLRSAPIVDESAAISELAFPGQPDERVIVWALVPPWAHPQSTVPGAREFASAAVRAATRSVYARSARARVVGVSRNARGHARRVRDRPFRDGDRCGTPRQVAGDRLAAWLCRRGSELIPPGHQKEPARTPDPVEPEPAV